MARTPVELYSVSCSFQFNINLILPNAAHAVPENGIYRYVAALSTSYDEWYCMRVACNFGTASIVFIACLIFYFDASHASRCDAIPTRLPFILFIHKGLWLRRPHGTTSTDHERTIRERVRRKTPGAFAR